MLKLEEPKLEKIKLGFYPYTYVRTVVMRSLLFRRDDYIKMLKMSFSEIAKFLQESHYRKEINEFGTSYSGVDLLELALNRNLAGSFKKLMRVSSYELGLLVKEYAKRKDIEDIKTILRGKFTHANEKDILNSLTAAGTLSYDFLVSLLKKDSIEEVLKTIRMADFAMFENGLKELKEKNTLAGIENALDQYYYAHLLMFSGTLPKEGALFKNFLLKEIEVLNLLTLLRLKKANFDPKSIKYFLILTGYKKKDSKFNALISTKDLEDLSKRMSKTEYKDIFEKGMEEFTKNRSLIMLETRLYKHLLRQSILLLHQHMLSVDVILGYMFAKDIEIRNLRIIIKGKQLGLSEQFIESQLVYE
ncbi:ATP synthase A1 subunit C [Candidatus Woesearchaeota archaeon]|nr:ATP synthase A1 subunit C [Candidatus Woesearchaeota archaeon]